MKTVDMKDIRFKLDDALEQDRDNREQALDDLQFLTGEQWPETIKAAREADERPCITINRMPQFVRQVTGDIRQTNPAIDVMPGDADASEEMADMLAGVIRGIEYQWDASSIYERAAESAAACGMGAFRVYYQPSGEENEIVIAAIPDPFAVVWDPLAKDPTRKDANYCFVLDRMSKATFEEQFPDAQAVDFEVGDVDTDYRNWYSTDTVTVAEYWSKKDGKVYWSKVSGVDVLEGPVEFPGKDIPVFAVTGEETHIGNRVVRSSVIRYAKDAQRLYNYWRSAQVEQIALQPKSPYIGTVRQFSGFEAEWQNANKSNFAYLPYNPDPDAPGAPQRSQPPMGSSAMMQEIMIAADEMKATTGIYDAALGDSGNEKSGVAIRQRQIESDISTSIYVDNLSKSIAQCGRVIVSLIAKIYDTTRLVRAIGVDGAASVVELNVPIQTPFGPVYMNDPAAGIYDVRIKTGPSYSTQKQEAVENMISFVQAFPAAAAIAGDLVARNMDWPGAEELADRLAKMLPPGMADQPEELTPEQQQAQQAQMAQQQQEMQMQQMLAQLGIQKQQAETKEAEADAMEAAADAQKAQVEAQRAQMEMAAQSGQLNAAIAQIVQEEVARALMARMPQMGPTF